MVDPLLPKDFAVRYVFQKMYSPQNTLVAVECLSRFDDDRFSPDYFFSVADDDARERIFTEQLALIEKYRWWFVAHDVTVTINVDDTTLNLLLCPAIKEKVRQLGCVHFEVTEYARKLLSHTRADWHRTREASVLWLDDFGAGNAGLQVLDRCHFDYVKIDKGLFWSLMQKSVGKLLMASLVDFFSQNKQKVIVEGVESERHRAWLSGMNWFAVQGFYWQEVGIEQLVQGDNR